MERRDLIEDQINQLGLVLSRIFSKIIGLKSKGLGLESVIVINQELKDECKTDNLLELSDDEFIFTLENNKNFNCNNLEKLATNLMLTAEELEVNEKINLYQKSLKIFELINTKELTYSHERFLKMKSIEDVLLTLAIK